MFPKTHLQEGFNKSLKWFTKTEETEVLLWNLDTIVKENQQIWSVTIQRIFKEYAQCALAEC